MPHINCLPAHVADLIAAGEVVERPASVVKELLENAIDAGASAVAVEVEHGGLTYLRVTDNGCGIAQTELPTAFLRHATSKLRTAEDLAAIGTLGFRGEALAAISAVSHLDIFSRTADAPAGAALHLDGGVPAAVEPAGCPEGTTICVRDLFYNTPARLKFMKKDSAEGAAVSGVVQHLALSHPQVSFKLLRDGAEVLHTPGDGQLLSAVYAAMGREFALGLVPIRGCGGEVNVEGFVTKPLCAHGSRGKQVFFVNGRFVKSQLLTAALEEAYRNQMMKGKFPGCVLHVNLPTHMVDVNVHPAKTVVKFVSEKAVFDAVYYTVLDALNTPAAPVAADKPSAAAVPSPQPFFKSMTAQQYKTAAPAMSAAEKKPLGSFTSRPPAAAPIRVHDVSDQSGLPFTVTLPQSGHTYQITPPDKKPVTSPPAAKSEVPADRPEGSLPAEQTAMPSVCAAPWRIVGEVLKTYIICEDDAQNVWLIDKHAAHERIRFDALKANTGPLMSQPLLTPLTAALDEAEYAAVLEHLPLLEEFGFVCEDFGGGTVLVREIPADIRSGDAVPTLEELAHKLTLGVADPAAARDELLHTMACKSAIKAGMTTDESELRVLVERVRSGEIRYCPHGRPVAYQLTKYEIEKLFKRA